MYLHRILDSEENTVKYERFILTDKDCKNLIQESIDVYRDCENYGTIKEFLEDVDYIIDNRILQFLDKNKNTEIDAFGNGYELALEILKANNIKIYDITEKYITY